MKNRAIAKASIFVLFLGFFSTGNLALTYAATNVTATGTNAAVCNQTVSNTSNVIAYRLSGGDCVVEFKNAATITWTTPSGVNSVAVLTVGGGGGGGGGSRANTDGYRGAGGGGEGGEVVYTSTYSISGLSSISVVVGAGGTSGAANNNASGYGSSGGAGGASSFNSANTAAGGTGGGVMSAENQTGSGGDGGGLIGSCGSSASQSYTGSLNNFYAGCNDFEGAGGGAGSGGNGTSGVDIGGPGGSGGAGGNGTSNSITSNATTFGGGGGGGGTSGSTSSLSGSAGSGGSGGGGGGSIYGSPSPATSGTANTGGGGGGGAGYSNATQVATSGGAGGSGIVIVRYVPDTTSPTFTSSTSFSVLENLATTSAAAAIKISESATVTITGGADISLFTISNSDSVTALIKFITSPDYEKPSDVGGNNVYDLILTATDPSSNVGTQTITITVTDVLDTSSFNSFSISGTAIYRTALTITANVTVAAKVTFKAKNVIITGCKNKLATGSGSSFSVTCSWKPSVRGNTVLTATATPTSGSISSSTATPLSVNVSNRTGSR